MKLYIRNTLGSLIPNLIKNAYQNLRIMFLQKRFFFYTLCAILSLQSCAERVGCIDPKAVNYDSNAQLASNDCVYPTLAIEFDFKMGNLPFEINRIYTINGHKTAFKELQFYISQIKLVRSDQTSIEVNNLYPLVKKTNTHIPIGTAFLETYEQLQFNVGVDPAANALITNYLTDASHPLALQSPDTMHLSLNEGYIFLKMVGKVDRNGDGIPNENESFDFRIGSNTLLQSIDLPIQKTLTESAEAIALEIDVAMLLDSVNLQIEKKTHTSDNFALAQKIAHNIPQAITVQY